MITLLTLTLTLVLVHDFCVANSYFLPYTQAIRTHSIALALALTLALTLNLTLLPVH